MNLNELRPAEGSKRERRRIGRGHGSGWGKTAGKGHNGQKQRSGTYVSPAFEGGQMPIVRRVPKRGFSNHEFKIKYATINTPNTANIPIINLLSISLDIVSCTSYFILLYKITNKKAS